MSRIITAIKNKNIIERTHRNRRREELLRLKRDTQYSASLQAAFKKIDALLQCEEISGIRVKVPEKHLSRFSEAIYSDGMVAYEIEQCADSPDEFIIRNKVI